MIGQEVRRGEVANYPFNILEGDGKLTDISGNQLHATIVGATPTTDHQGRANRGYNFGTEQYIVTPNLTIGNVFSFAVGISYELNKEIFYIGLSGTDRIRIAWNAKTRFAVYIVQNNVTRAQIDYVFATTTAINSYYFLSGSVDLTNSIATLYNAGIAGTDNGSAFNSAMSADIVSTAFFGRSPFGDNLLKQDFCFLSNQYLQSSEHLQLYNNWRK